MLYSEDACREVVNLLLFLDFVGGTQLILTHKVSLVTVLLLDLLMVEARYLILEFSGSRWRMLETLRIVFCKVFTTPIFF
jgi:hypothetical protein